MTFLLTGAPPLPITATSPPLATVAWRGYCRVDNRQPWADAVDNSIVTHTARTGVAPVWALVCSRGDTTALRGALRAAGLAVLDRAAVVMAGETWGLA